MNKEKLYKKWFDKTKRPDDYDSTPIFNIEDENKHKLDIALIYSGRKRAKSFRVSADALADAYYNDRQFCYSRRWAEEMKIDDIEAYFADKVEYIKDMTDGEFNGVKAERGKLFLSGTDEEGNILKGKQIGIYININRSRSKKSQQFPLVYTLIYEEVFTLDPYCPKEPSKVLDLISTLNRGKEGDFKTFLISNTVSRINPYVTDWSLKNLAKQKSGSIDLYRLNLGSFDAEGLEEYYLIACEYLEDARGEAEYKSVFGKKKSLIKTSSLSNDWDINELYPCIHQQVLKVLGIEPQYTAIFESEAFKFKADIINIPINLYDYLSTIEDIEEFNKEDLDDSTFEVVYISRKTGDIKPETRAYSTGVYLSPYITNHLAILNDGDEIIDECISRGWVCYTDNLTANEFNQIIGELR